MIRAGQEFRYYRLEKQIDEGRLGTVYQAVDQRCAQAVAVKLLKPDITEDPVAQRQVMAVLGPAIYFSHPGVMRVFNADVTEGETIVIIELLSGPSLAQLFAAMRTTQRWIPMAEALAVVARLGDALDYVQHHGALRRRLLPAKIRFRIEESPASGIEQGNRGRQLCPIIADLGIDMDLEIRNRLRNERIVTQPMLNYVAPEELQGKVTDGRADVFALAMITLELVCGRQVFEAERVADAVNVHVNHQIRVRQLLRPDQPEALMSLLERALSSKPSDRPATVREFVDGIAAIAGGNLPATLPREASAGSTSLLEEFQAYRDIPKPTAGKAPAQHGNQAEKEKPQPLVPSVAQSERVGVEVTSPAGDVRIITVTQDAARIGRSPANEIVLEDESKRISREHATMRFLKGNWHVEDHHSGNGTHLDGQRLPPDVATRWDKDAIVQVEGYKLRLVAPQPMASNKQEQDAVASPDKIFLQSLGVEVPRTRIVFSAGEGRIGMFLETTLIEVEPGKPAQCPVVVLNQSASSLQIHAKLLHSLAGDIILEPGSVQLQPGEQRLLVLSINLLRLPQCRAGLFPLQMVIADRAAPQHAVTVDLRIQIRPFSAYQVRTAPERPQVGETFEVEIDNEGNTSQEFVIMIWDDNQGVIFEPNQAELQIRAGETGAASFATSLARSHWFGTRQHKAKLQISADGGETQARVIDIASRGAIG